MPSDRSPQPNRKLIFLELNEIPWQVFDAYCERNPDSAVTKLLAHSVQRTTVAPDSGGLHPWSTWSTLHRGVSNEVHGIDHFGQNTEETNARNPPLWTLLTRGGKRVGIFGALHTYPFPEHADDYSFIVPDTFAKGPECLPAALSRFQAFNLAMARQSARNVAAGINWTSALSFLVRAPMLGLRPKTVFALANQLWSERGGPHLRSRRRSFQSVIGFDLFERLLRKTKPDYCNFFTNHVASAMHRYWAARFPNDFESLGFSEDWLRRFEPEIDFAMDIVDDFVHRLVVFVDRNDEYRLVLASSMGQGPHDAAPILRQLYLRDAGRFMEAAGLAKSDWQKRPTMDPDVAFRVRDERADDFRRFAASVEIAGHPLTFDEKEQGFFNLTLGQRNLEGDFKVRIGSEAQVGADLGLVNEKVDDETASSGYHVPEGTFVLYDPRTRQGDSSRSSVSTLDLAPWVLSSCGVEVPSYMNQPGALATD
jgi:hypothetical protein